MFVTESEAIGLSDTIPLEKSVVKTRSCVDGYRNRINPLRITHIYIYEFIRACLRIQDMPPSAVIPRATTTGDVPWCRHIGSKIKVPAVHTRTQDAVEFNGKLPGTFLCQTAATIHLRRQRRSRLAAPLVQMPHRRHDQPAGEFRPRGNPHQPDSIPYTVNVSSLAASDRTARLPVESFM